MRISFHIVEIQVVHSEWSKLPKTAVFLPLYQEENRFDPFVQSLDAVAGKQLAQFIASGENSGKWREASTLRPEGSLSPIFIFGAGKKKEFNLDKLRSLSALAIRAARQMRIESLAIPVGHFLSLPSASSAQAAVEGAILGLYRFMKYKKEETNGKEGFPKKLLLVVEKKEESKEAEQAVERGKILAEAACFTRNLVNEPSNVMTPTAFAEEAQSLAQKLGLELKIFGKEEIQNLGMEAFLSVAKGSAEPPKLIVLKYKGKGSFTLGLVGKGVTFDSGGISIKPSENMQYMTNDMAGAATCLGAMKAVAELKIPLNIIAILPMAENLPDGNAYKPGDIIKSYSGKTIEIINTDAEGRMLLADGLAYISSLEVNAVVDLATLTGAIGVAIGSAATGLFSNHEALREEIVKASEEAQEPVWPLPIFEEYTHQVKGSFADLKNTGGRKAGACTAAAFLKEFVGEVPWAHLDIAGTAFLEDEKIPHQFHSYLPEKGATGVGVRTIAYLAERLSQKKGWS